VGLPVLLLGSLLLLSFQQSPARPQQTQSTSQGTKSTTTHQHKQPHQARGMLDTLTLMAQELSTKHFLAFGLLSILLIVVFVSLLTIQQMTLEDPPHNAVSRSSSQQQPRT
jgi:NADH:ubiquinone oxidoreductase subunit 6 (subunit J)